MEKLRVGIMMNPYCVPTNGGTYYYYQALLNGINEFDFNEAIEIVNIFFYTGDIPSVKFKHESLFIKTPSIVRIKENFKSKSPSLFISYIKRSLPIKHLYELFKEKRNRKVEQILMDKKIDILYYLIHENKVLNYPFITTNWDVGHKSIYPFPEVALNGNYESRENYYLNILNKALLILCESEAGLKEFQHYYNVYSPKVKVVPIFGSDVIKLNVPENQQKNVLIKHGVKKMEYFFYPAQFWPLKNHYNLLLAFREIVLKEGNGHLKLVLCGSDMGNMGYIKEQIIKLSLQGNVLVAGFVSNEELYAIYKNAIALVMPTFLGPTNMPLLEAAHLKCPVLCSNLDGHKEMMGENAIYFNPEKAIEIQETMEKILYVSNREELVNAAYQHVLQSPFNLQNSLAILNDALLSIIPIRKAWGIDSRRF